MKPIILKIRMFFNLIEILMQNYNILNSSQNFIKDNDQTYKLQFNSRNGTEIY